MLTKPENGWTIFSLVGCDKYYLSFLDDIAFYWVAQAIHGLEYMIPFCVKGSLEPNRFLCTVSYWNCHIIIEDELSPHMGGEFVKSECSHTSMLDFCKFLYNDIHQYVDAWTQFPCSRDLDMVERKKLLVEKLERLNELIEESKKHFIAINISE